MIKGTLAAAATPLRDGGRELDEAAFGPLVDFLAGAGLDGLLALGTTGEGILLSVAERRRVAELFVEAAAGRLQVAVHCGAQTTADTVALAEHAAGLGVAGIAVIAPPYFRLDDDALLRALRRRRFGLRAHAVLRLRVRVDERLRGSAARRLRAT